MKQLFTAMLTLLLSSSFVAGCSTSGKNAAASHVVINATGSVANTVTNSTGNGINHTDSNVTNVTSNVTRTNTPASSTNVPANHTSTNHTSTKATSPTNNSSNPNGSSTPSSKHSGAVSNTTHSSDHTNSTAGEPSNQSSKLGTNTTTDSTSKSSNSSSASASPSEIAATWTNRFNSMYANRNYTGPNSSAFNGLVEEMAEGKITPDAVKKTILGMQPWNATWTAANNGDGKTYQFVVHDVGAFTYQTSVLNDDVTSQEWQANAGQVLDDSFYTKWEVHWNSSTKKYTVAFLNVGFYLNSTN